MSNLKDKTFGDFSFEQEFEDDDGVTTLKYTHVDSDAYFQIKQIRAKWWYVTVLFSDSETEGVEVAFGDIPYTYIENAVHRYQTKGTFGVEPILYEDIDVTLTEIRDARELPAVPDDMRPESYLSQVNAFTFNKQISFNGAEGVLLEAFLQNMHSYLWEYGAEIRWAVSLSTGSYLARLEQCYGYDAEMFLDDSWIEYAEANGHITVEQ